MIHLIIVAILVALSTFLLGYFLTNADLLPAQASQQAVTIDGLMGIHFWLIAFFFSLIVVFILYSVVVFRRRKGEQGDGVYSTGNTRLEIIWTVVPIGIVLWLAVIGSAYLANVERADPQAMQVDVFAAQWNWRFQYDNGVVSPDLVLPVDRQVILRLHSEDVIHSFYVPEFRVKQDVLPGGDAYVRELRITPNQAGQFKVQCAEICGQLHYDMRADVIVVAQAEFDQWLEQQGGECDLEDAECGERWATQFGCVACHSQDGTVIVGPSWQGVFGSEEDLADGSSTLVDEAYLRESILDPNAQVVGGFAPGIMPQNFAELLTDEQIDQIIAFIESLQ
jgi:cytochrome c oxidase subunit 2